MDYLNIIVTLFGIACAAFIFYVLYNFLLKNKNILTIEKTKDDYIANKPIEKEKSIDKFLIGNITVEQMKEHIALIEKTKMDLKTSDKKEIEVDYVIASAILKNWDSKVLVDENGRIVLTNLANEHTIKVEPTEKTKSEDSKIIIKTKDGQTKNLEEEYVDVETQIKKKESIPIDEEKNGKILNEKIPQIIHEIKSNNYNIAATDGNFNNDDELIKDEDALYHSIKLSITSEDDLKNFISNIIGNILDKKNINDYTFVKTQKDDKEFLFISSAHFFKEIVMSNSLFIDETYMEELLLLSEKLNDIKSDLISHCNSIFQDDLFLCTEVKKKNQIHIAKPVMFVFNEGQEDEIIVRDFYLALTNFIPDFNYENKTNIFFTNYGAGENYINKNMKIAKTLNDIRRNEGNPF